MASSEHQTRTEESSITSSADRLHVILDINNNIASNLDLSRITRLGCTVLPHSV